jgi:aldose 1-epimerase
VGRVANRIAGSRFTLDGFTHVLPANEGRHHLHGGPGGFAHRAWTHDAAAGDDGRSACFRLVSDDGDQGYPGRLEVAVTYTLDDADAFTIRYDAATDRATPLNLTNHAYFNLAGRGDVLGHELWLDADRWLPIDADLIPTGEIASVTGTPLDFREPRRIGERIAELGPPTDGYDQCLAFRSGRDVEAPCIRLQGPNRRTLEILTTEPAVQLYSANRLRDAPCRGGVRFGRHGAVCLETQGFPDAVHHPRFPSIVLRPPERWTSTTVLSLATMA